MIIALILLPALSGAAAFLLRSKALRKALLAAAAVGHSLLTFLCWLRAPAPAMGGWLELDSLGLLFLSITSTLFLAASAYAIDYLRSNDHPVDEEEGVMVSHAPDATFIGCVLFFLSAMTLVVMSHHFGLMWIGVEATTLASAPLIYYHRHHRSLEATYKYLLICSVGIALALLGNFFLAVAAHKSDPSASGMLSGLIAQAGSLEVSWLKAAFILFLVGYGTKMGLAPMHTWLPDAHSESPAVISALLSGALLNCAFLGILRLQQVLAAAGLASFGRELLLVLGLASMLVAAIFIVGQTDYKRLLAYSSVEHMGILALGMGLGGAGAFGSLLHAVNHSLTKAMLFMTAGNILALHQTKAISQVRGLLRQSPFTGVLWVGGFLAITGSPPFGPFLSEFTILKASLDQGRIWVGVTYLALLAFIFIGMATAVLAMAQGAPVEPLKSGGKKPGWLALAPPAALGLAVLVLGCYVPAPLAQLLHAAAGTIGGL
jgi:hydrogenase-4 component F